MRTPDEHRLRRLRELENCFIELSTTEDKQIKIPVGAFIRFTAKMYGVHPEGMEKFLISVMNKVDEV